MKTVKLPTFQFVTYFIIARSPANDTHDDFIINIK